MKTQTLESALFDMRDKSKVCVSEASNLTGIPENTLYRKASLTDPDIQFKIDEIVPVMRAFKRFDPLYVMAKTCGFLLVKVPAGQRALEKDIGDYQEQFGKLCNLLFKFMHKPSDDLLKEIDVICHDHMRSTVSIQTGCRSKVGQYEMEMD